MNKILIQFYKSRVGELILGSYNRKLCLCDWRYRKNRNTIDNRINSILNSEYVLHKFDLFDSVVEQLEEYFEQNRKQFDIPLLMVGSIFQKKVWNELLKISYGSTSTYSILAENLGDKKLVRAVANANGANSISILIPCHRVIGKDGKMVGYAGGINTKEKLLDLESELPLFSHLNTLQNSIS